MALSVLRRSCRESCSKQNQAGCRYVHAVPPALGTKIGSNLPRAKPTEVGSRLPRWAGFRVVSSPTTWGAARAAPRGTRQMGEWVAQSAAMGQTECRAPTQSGQPGHGSFSSSTIRRSSGVGLHCREPGELLDGRWLGTSEPCDPSPRWALGRVSDHVHASHRQSNNPGLTPAAPVGWLPPAAGCLYRSWWFPRRLAIRRVHPPDGAPIFSPRTPRLSLAARKLQQTLPHLGVRFQVLIGLPRSTTQHLTDGDDTAAATGNGTNGDPRVQQIIGPGVGPTPGQQSKKCSTGRSLSCLRQNFPSQGSTVQGPCRGRPRGASPAEQEK